MEIRKSNIRRLTSKRLVKSIWLMSAIATTSKYKESESRQRRHFSTVHSISSTLANFLSTLTRQQLFEVHYSLHWLNSRWKETVRSSEVVMSATANATSKHRWQSSRNAHSLILMSFYKKIGFAQKERKCDDVFQNENASPGKRLVKNPHCYCSVNESSNKEK